jgi:thiamine pyrophosphate-dependent acetolactate synthase large subunit-like protein
MGVSFGFAIASASLYPKKNIVMVLGDSAFGFSCMELETAARHRLPLKVVIINNNGIGIGTEEIEEDSTPKDTPVNALLPSAKYEMIAEAFGGVGKSTDSYEEL